MEVGLFVEFPCRDGMSEQEAFVECFTLVDEAEASGVDSVWLAEYHFAPISVLSSPLMVASAIAARTQRIRIGLAVALLPLGHPIHVAEDVATLDHISQGRVEFGTVIEYRTRYFSYYSGQLAYSYAVNGEYYSGFHDKYFFRERSAQRYVDELKGKPAFVRHKANNPEVSTVLREDQQSVWPLQIR